MLREAEKARAEGLWEWEARMGLARAGYVSQTWIKALRTQSELSQPDFSLMLRVSVGTYRKWEAEGHEPGFLTVVRFLMHELCALSFDDDFDPRESLLGKLLLTGVLDREQATKALEHLGEVIYATPEIAPKELAEVVA